MTVGNFIYVGDCFRRLSLTDPLRPQVWGFQNWVFWIELLWAFFPDGLSNVDLLCGQFTKTV